MKITKDIHIETLVEFYPKAVNYLSKKSIQCIACGEPVWGTLGELAKQKGFSDDQINIIISDIENL